MSLGREQIRRFAWMSYRAAGILAFLWLAVLLGYIVTSYKLFPYSHLRNARIGGEALYAYIVGQREIYSESVWRPARTPERGVTRHVPEKAFDGLTLFTSTNGQKATLVSMNGDIVHEWHLPFSAVWNDPPHVSESIPDDRVHLRSLYLWPNGDLLVIYYGLNTTPWGLGLVKMDKNSKPLWKISQHVHHDTDVAEDGTIYTLGHRIRRDSVDGLANIRPPFVDDQLVILTPEGDELKSINLIEALRDSDYRGILDDMIEILSWKNLVKGDILHANSVDLVRADMDDVHDYLPPGTVLVGLRNLHALIAIDPDTERVIWATTGVWRHQHDPDFLEDGTILIFDNVGNPGKGGGSRIVEFDPQTSEVIWQYTGDQTNPFFSAVRSSQQRLPNGNTLITETNAGRIFEVTRDGEVVWEYYNPSRTGEGDRLIATLLEGQRFSLDALSFLP